MRRASLPLPRLADLVSVLKGPVGLAGLGAASSTVLRRRSNSSLIWDWMVRSSSWRVLRWPSRFWSCSSTRWRVIILACAFWKRATVGELPVTPPLVRAAGVLAAAGRDDESALDMVAPLLRPPIRIGG